MPFQAPPPAKIDYASIDQEVLHLYTGKHPALMTEWLPKESPGLFQADPAHQPTQREKKHRLLMKIERLLGLELSKKHYRLVR